MLYTELKKDPSRYLMYLRKSRNDDPNESVEEVLIKHEGRLQEYAERELGGRIPETNVFREVVSGDSIDARIEIKKVFDRIEDSEIIGVLVADPQRLGRPELRDADTIISSFRFTGTFVVTPQMVYDLENKMARRFFQDELLRGRDYLDYVKEVLRNGKEASVKRGCYIMSTPPFGYDRVKIGKDWTLKPNDSADLVHLIFEWYVKEGMTSGRIAQRLNDLGHSTMKGKRWQRGTVAQVLENVHYIGKVRYYDRKRTVTVENGERVTRLAKQPDEQVWVYDGLHPAIVETELYEAAQALKRNHPRYKAGTELKNVLAGILRCGKCGCAMSYHTDNVKTGRKARYRCEKPFRDRCVGYSNMPNCCQTALASEVIDAVLLALREMELPALQAKVDNGDGDAAVVQKKLVDGLVKQMEDYRARMDKLHELVESGVYTPQDFSQRRTALREKMDSCEKELHHARAAMPKRIDYGEKVVALRTAVDALADPDMDNNSTNKLLRRIIDRIDYFRDAQETGEEIVLNVYLRLE